MAAMPRTTVGKILHLLRRIHIRPVHIAMPLLLAMAAATFEGLGMGLLIPILTGFLQKSFAFVMETPYLGAIMLGLPEAIRMNDRLLFTVLLGSFIVIYTLRSVLQFCAVVGMAYFSERTNHHLRKELFAQYMRCGKQFFDGTHLGHHSVVLMEFSRNALQPVSSMDRFVNAVFSLLAYFSVMIMISWKLTIIVMPLFLLMHVMVRTIIVRLRKLSYATAQRGSELNRKSVEILSTIPLVKSYRMERQEQDRYADISNQKSKFQFRAIMFQSAIRPIQEVVTLLVVCTVFMGALALLGREQIASAPAIIVYFYIVVNAANKIGTLSGIRGTIANAEASLSEVLTVFDDQGKCFVQGGDETFPGIYHSIECRNLTFSYTDRNVLEDVSFTVRKGEMTAIVGPSGAGKSTLINLLMRYYDCPPGTLFIDRKDIRSFSLDSYMAHVAIVSQETLLLHDSLRNNILYGLESVSDAKLQDVVRRARLSEYVAELPDGLNTLIGDRGVKLSGGEKQRVSIARALLKGTEILILDEATSSLDSQTEKLIQEAIDEAVQGRTAIVIAHRLSTVKNADKIIVLKEGCVDEEGTLEELLEKRGLFYRLWEEQKF
jgi:ATP-binding cassette, subfamily B, bacterial MsbA